MINVAIAGYGNLGKSLEQQIRQRDDMRLVRIFSRRKIDNPLQANFDDATKATDIDVCLLALGSYADLRENIRCFANFNTVDCFDDHAETDNYMRLLQQTKPDTVSLACVGWDPGILSLVRGIFAPLGTVATTWGKGQSMGHGNALRAIRGVLDGVQFTVPYDNASKRFFDGQTKPQQLVRRVCFVACADVDKEAIRRQITTMPDYFDGYETEVNFVSQQEVRALKADMSHCGNVYAKGKYHTAETTLQVANNADFTAAIMINCAFAVQKLAADGYKGPFSLFDVPMRYFADKTCL